MALPSTGTFREMFAMCDDSQLAFLVSKAAKDDANKGYLKMNVADIPDDYRESYLKKDWEDVNFQKELANSLAERLEFEFTAPLVAPISEGDILGVALYDAVRRGAGGQNRGLPQRGDGAAHDGRAAGRMGG